VRIFERYVTSTVCASICSHVVYLFALQDECRSDSCPEGRRRL
jgi:hypothetical protein